MKNIIFICFISICFINIKSQDKIINTNQDTIHCTIVSISDERILYEFEDTEGIISGKFIDLKEVSEYYRSKRPENAIILKFNWLHKYTPQTRLYIGIDAGKSNFPWFYNNYEAPIPQYYNKLKTGFHINANVNYMFRTYFGIGIKYSFLNTKTNGQSPVEYMSQYFMITSNKIYEYYNYLGLSIIFQQQFKSIKKLKFSQSISGGINIIRRDFQSNYYNTTIQYYITKAQNVFFIGNSFSGQFALTAEYQVLKNISLGIGSNFLLSTIKKGTIELKNSDGYNVENKNHELPNPMKLSRFDYSIIIRYNL